MRKKRALRVFISYSHHDATKAKRLANELVNVGIDVWIYEWGIKAGDCITEKVFPSIETCDVFIVMLSRQSLESKWVHKEIGIAIQRKLSHCGHVPFQIIPIRIDACKLPTEFSDTYAIKYSSDPSTLLHELLPIVAPGLGLDPCPEIQHFTREQFFEKAIAVLRFPPAYLCTDLVGPIFLSSKAMIDAKQTADGEKRPSFSLALRAFLLGQLDRHTSEISIVIKLSPRYQRVLENLRKNIDFEKELARMRGEVDLFFQDSRISGIRYAVSRDFHYSFMVTDRILIETERDSDYKKAENGWSTTQPAVIMQRKKMFDTAFERIYVSNQEAKAEVLDYFESVISNKK